MPARTPRKSRTIRLDFYRDADRKWRWRSLSQGRVVAESGEGYSRRIDATAAVGRLLGFTLSDIEWHVTDRSRIYGQAPLADGFVELNVWRLWIRGKA